jgi:hypothetical protein
MLCRSIWGDKSDENFRVEGCMYAVIVRTCMFRVSSIGQ